MDEFVQRVRDLPRPQLIEAALAMRAEFEDLGAEFPAELSSFRDEMKGQPFGNIGTIEQLLRVLLLACDASPEHRATVREIVGATGKKAFVFGGPEILAAGTIAVLLLQVLLSKGRTRTIERLEVVKGEGGKDMLRYEKEEVFGLNAKALSVLSGLKFDGPKS